MYEVSVDAMLTEAGVIWKNAQILFRHLKQFFGRSLVVSEKKRQAYLGNNDFPPVVDNEVLPDKTIVSHQISDMLSAADLQGLPRMILKF